MVEVLVVWAAPLLLCAALVGKLAVAKRSGAIGEGVLFGRPVARAIDPARFDGLMALTAVLAVIVLAPLAARVARLVLVAA
ncbi:hypothetical protein [Caulobacter sp. 17J65-9]|uniref:hypothetical protein n=1 Tax=Caulobacter sp. 17J65-9 TaxID=2709382 RepID=UPI0013C9C9B9|nr:hypothetical protein [Caulobacter sp. 17J65-9]NEX95164.1 hypothetical protein [Caulobacter sp. 17J65-9]